MGYIKWTDIDELQFVLTPAQKDDLIFALVKHLGLRIQTRYMPDIGGYEYRLVEDKTPSASESDPKGASQ